MWRSAGTQSDTKSVAEVHNREPTGHRETGYNSSVIEITIGKVMKFGYRLRL
jgi:hypothetical protein